MKRGLIAALVMLVLLIGGAYLAAQRLLASDLVRTQLEQQLTARLRQPVHIGSASAHVFPGLAVDLAEVTIGKPVALRLGRLRVFTGARALFADAIDIREVRVIDGRPGAEGKALSFDLDASVLGDRLDVKALTLRGPTTTIEAKGALSSIARVEGVFDARSDLLDLSELVAMSGALASPAPAKNASPSPLHLSVRLGSTKVRFGAYEFRDLSTTIDLVASRATLDPLSLHLFGGSFRGRLEATTTDTAPTLRLAGTITDLDVTDLLKLTGSSGGITGRLSGDVSLSGYGADGTALMRSARGTIAATIARGTLPHLDIIRTVVLAFGKPSGPTPGGSGTSFDRLGGTFMLADGTLRSEHLSLRSHDLDADGRGTLTIDTGAVNARGDVVLSKDLTRQAGSDLRRYAQQDGRVIVPVTLQGTLDRPSLFIDVAAAAKRAVTNELQRRATDFIGGLFKKKKGGG